MKPLTIAPPASYSPDYKSAPLPLKAASELPPPEPQGQRERSGLAAGSLPVLDAEGLAKLWKDEANAVLMATTRAGYNSHTAMTRAYAKAHQLETCAKELRLLVAHTKSRQPEKNAEISHAPSADKTQ